jgi:hypothetical protein
MYVLSTYLEVFETEKKIRIFSNDEYLTLKIEIQKFKERWISVN